MTTTFFVVILYVFERKFHVTTRDATRKWFELHVNSFYMLIEI